jgi:hypothetical protein
MHGLQYLRHTTVSGSTDREGRGCVCVMLEIENKTGTTRIKMEGLGGKSETEEMHLSTKMALYQNSEKPQKLEANSQSKHCQLDSASQNMQKKAKVVCDRVIYHWKKLGLRVSVNTPILSPMAHHT